jgi:hypothetical protein
MGSMLCSLFDTYSLSIQVLSSSTFHTHASIECVLHAYNDQNLYRL